MALSKKVATVQKQCVSCGACVKVCPKNALSIYKGLYAKVESVDCVGCGKCTKVCPASAIHVVERGGMYNG